MCVCLLVSQCLRACLCISVRACLCECVCARVCVLESVLLVGYHCMNCV